MSIPLKHADVSNRYNYQKGDYRNYRDGDQKSSIARTQNGIQMMTRTIR